MCDTRIRFECRDGSGVTIDIGHDGGCVLAIKESEGWTKAQDLDTPVEASVSLETEEMFRLASAIEQAAIRQLLAREVYELTKRRRSRGDTRG